MIQSIPYFKLILKNSNNQGTWPVQSLEHVTHDLKVRSSSPMWGVDPTIKINK